MPFYVSPGNSHGKSLPTSGTGAQKGAVFHMTDCYKLWVDLPNKLISPVEISGFSEFVYESKEALERVVKMLSADGYRISAA